MLAVAAALVTALIVAGCGRDDFNNDPRPPVPAEITAKIGDGRVVVAPAEFGAGPTNFEIANLGNTPATLVIEGPSDTHSDEIPARGNTILQTQLETGAYTASVDGAEGKSFAFTVGPERESGQNDLLLP